MEIKASTNHEHYIVISESCFDGEQDFDVVGVYHFRTEAEAALRDQVDTMDGPTAKGLGFMIDVNESDCFIAYQNGEYLTNHITVCIIRKEG